MVILVVKIKIPCRYSYEETKKRKEGIYNSQLAD
jgi:hypothetical protein